VYTFGEIWHAAASFELAFGLALPHAQGQYAGAFSLGQGVANAAGPAILTALCLDHGLPGWLVLGALLMGLGLLMPCVVRWTQRNRAVASPLPSGTTTCPPDSEAAPRFGRSRNVRPLRTRSAAERPQVQSAVSRSGVQDDVPERP
jgi:MFS family permease